MSPNVYYYLENLGFSKQEIKYIEDTNDFIYEATSVRLDYIVEFLKERKLTDKEIHELFLDNPWMVSEALPRLNIIDDMLNELRFNPIDKRNLLLGNNRTYNINPDKLSSLIKYLRLIGKMDAEIKKFILDNPSYISMEFEEVKKLILSKYN